MYLSVHVVIFSADVYLPGELAISCLESVFHC